MTVDSSQKIWRLDLEGDELVRQRVAFLVATYLGTCPLHREFGIKPPIDFVSAAMTSKIKSDVMIAVKKYVPEFVVSNIAVVKNEAGTYDVRLEGEVANDQG